MHVGDRPFHALLKRKFMRSPAHNVTIHIDLDLVQIIKKFNHPNHGEKTTCTPNLKDCSKFNFIHLYHWCFTLY